MLTNSLSDIKWIDENGNITMDLIDKSLTLNQELKITARRKKLRRLQRSL